jgi:hypothetical protein
MNTTFQNSAQVLSIGLFFTLMIVGLSSSLPENLYRGLVAHGVSTAAATRVSHLPPVSTLFAAFLGYNPIQHLLGTSVLAQVPKPQQAILTGRSFFPSVITAPFRSGLHAALDLAIGASVLAAAASWTRGPLRADDPLPDRSVGRTASEGDTSPLRDAMGVEAPASRGSAPA